MLKYRGKTFRFKKCSIDGATVEFSQAAAGLELTFDAGPDGHKMKGQDPANGAGHVEPTAKIDNLAKRGLEHDVSGP
jgi:hypothetical protein